TADKLAACRYKRRQTALMVIRCGQGSSPPLRFPVVALGCSPRRSRCPYGDATMHRFRSLFVSLLALPLLAPCMRGEAPKRDHDITVDDYFTQADIFDAAISPDGQYVAYSEGRWKKSTGDRKTDLWVVGAKLRKPRRLTFDRAND